MNRAYSCHQAVLAFEPANVNNASAFRVMPNSAVAAALGVFASFGAFASDADMTNRGQSHATGGSV